ncbi:sugar ABC transporter ATP-binding protein [Roseibium sp. M-1]
MSTTILEMRGISKYYPGVNALEGVHLKVEKGEVHGLMGENGAGKSTLIKVLAGAIEPDEGKLVIDGREFTSLDPRQAIDLGIGVIYQELNLVPFMTVADNIFLGCEHAFGLFTRPSATNRAAKEILDSLGMDIDPTAQVSELTVAYQQMVEIAKVVSKNVKILVMDEPTAPLSSKEVAQLYRLIERLKSRGITIIYISHRMEEIFELTNKITVLRDGRYIQTVGTQETTRAQLISAMVGREINETIQKNHTRRGSPILDVKNLSGQKFWDVSFTAYEGEILGFGGLVGAGRTEVARAIFGADDIKSGEMWIGQSRYAPRSPKHATHRGVALIPEDRKQQGLLLSMSVRENATLASLPDYQNLGLISSRREDTAVQTSVDRLGIRTPTMEKAVRLLSGGNQQKVVLAKWLLTNARILILDEPTRGIDVGAKQEIYGLMRELTAQGLSIIMISSDMPELIGVSDRILVMARGRITGELERDAFSQERVLDLAAQ